MKPISILRFAVGTLAVVIAVLILCARAARAEDHFSVRDGLTGEVVRSLTITAQDRELTIAAPGYLPRRIRSNDWKPVALWPSDDPDFEFNVVYGTRTTSHLANLRDGVYGISLPARFADQPQYRQHLGGVISEVYRATGGAVTLRQVDESVADVRVRVDRNHEHFYLRDEEGLEFYALALAYVYKDRDGHNTQADLVFIHEEYLTDFEPGNALLHEVGHVLGLWHSKGNDVMGWRTSDQRFTQYSPRLTNVIRMMYQRLPVNKFPDDGRLVGFAMPRASSDLPHVFVCGRGSE